MVLPTGSIPLIDHSIIRRTRLLALLIQIEIPLNLIRDRRFQPVRSTTLTKIPVETRAALLLLVYSSCCGTIYYNWIHQRTYAILL